MQGANDFQWSDTYKQHHILAKARRCEKYLDLTRTYLYVDQRNLVNRFVHGFV